MSNWIRKLSLGQRAQMGNYLGRKMCAECHFGRCSQVKTSSPGVKKGPSPMPTSLFKTKGQGTLLSVPFWETRTKGALRTLPGSGGAKQEWKCLPNPPSPGEWTYSPSQPGIPISQLGNEASPLCYIQNLCVISKPALSPAAVEEAKPVISPPCSPAPLLPAYFLRPFLFESS